MKKNRIKLILIISLIILVFCAGIGYYYSTISKPINNGNNGNNSEEDGKEEEQTEGSTSNGIYASEEKDILDYLNTKFKYREDTNEEYLSPLLGLMSFNFNSIDGSKITMDVLKYSEMTSYSEATTSKEDELYLKEVNMKKSQYESLDNYVVDKSINCYTSCNKNAKCIKSCDTLCAKDESEIISELSTTEKNYNVDSNYVKKHCVKNPVYSLAYSNLPSFFSDIDTLKKTFKSITNKDLVIPSDIIKNKYYKYNLVLVSKSDELYTVRKILSVRITSFTNNIIDLNYTASSSDSGESDLSGTLTLYKNNKIYYIIANNLVGGGYEVDLYNFSK